LTTTTHASPGPPASPLPRQQWDKAGLLFEAASQRPWLRSHAAMPIVERIGRDALRMYFSARDERNRAHIGFCEIEAGDVWSVRAVAETPCLGPGALGTFDDSGVTSACLIEVGAEKYLYYSGWSLGVTVPFYLGIGLAVSRDGGRSFTRVSTAPILDRDEVDPYLTASPFVLVENDVWRMWYVSGSRWAVEDGVPKHYYRIKYAESADGRHWRRANVVCIDYASPDEHAIARPCVVKDGRTYRMWFSARGDRYRLGYAESLDGITWARDDGAVDLDISRTGWDSEMIAYPFVFEHRTRLTMLYNGNGYGRSGVGYAIRRR
jgi:hypothetical protein